MPSPAAPAASRRLVLLGLVLIGTLHLAILVAAFEVTPFLTLDFIGAVVAFIVALVVWRVPDDGASALIEERHGQHALEPPAAGPFIATTSGAADVSEWVSEGLEPCPLVAGLQLTDPDRTVADGRPLHAGLLRTLAVDTYVLLIADPDTGGFDEGATTVRVKLAGYRGAAPDSVEGVEALVAIRSLLDSGPLTVELEGRERDGIRMGSIRAETTPVAPR